MHQALTLGNLGQYHGGVRWFGAGTGTMLWMGFPQRGRVVSPSQVALAQLVELPDEARSAVVRFHQVTLSQNGS